jgi:hypothetical protein
MSLFDLEGDCLDQGYLNLRAAEYPQEVAIKQELEAMWLRYEPCAEADFAAGFARDPEGRFWEMHLGCALLDAGRTLQARVNRADGQGNPDLCVIDCVFRRIAATHSEASRPPVPIEAGHP